jgi:hypothetical protein
MASHDPNAGIWANLSYAVERATGFQIAPAKTGLFIRTLPTEYEPHGLILARVANGNLYLWDRDKRADVEISIEFLQRLANGGE